MQKLDILVFPQKNLWNNVMCLFFLSFLWSEGLVKVVRRGELEVGSGIVAWWPQAISSWVAAEKKVAYFNWRNPPPPSGHGMVGIVTMFLHASFM